MPTCNDCIHQELCNIYANAGVITDVPADDITICEVFKNKADVVEVVRCKDCMYYRSISKLKYCNKHIDCWGDGEIYTDEDDYCSYGERRSEE